MKGRNLWEEVGNACLKKASDMLGQSAAPTDDAVETAAKLVRVAIEIDMLNLRWAEQNRFGAAAYPDQIS